MIKRYTGMKAEKMQGSNPLPAGGYVATIKGAKVISYSWGEILEIAFDIAEGEHINFFANQYRNNTQEDKKWKGNYRITVPDESNKDYFESNQRTFNNLIYALEASNAGYHFDWDETKLKGLNLGVIFRDKEWEWEGKSGWTTECGAVTDIESIRTGDFKPLSPKPLKNKQNSQNTQPNTTVNDFQEIEDEDLPF